MIELATRREKVILELVDNFSSEMARAAAATAVLNKELHGLSGSSVQTSRTSRAISRDIDSVGTSAGRADKSINQLTGRLRLFADVAAILGPALVPIGAVAVPAVTGLANQLGVAALAGGTAILAFQGVGDALKAVNDAALEPTTANLEKAREELDKLSPAAQDLVGQLQSLRPEMAGLRDAAAEGMFPGLMRGLDSLETRLPDVERIISNVSSTLGEMLGGGGASLASGRWDDFFDFLATDATDTLTDLGHTVGSLTHGLAEMGMAFDPLNDDFSGWLRDVAAGFDEWAQGLDQTEDFQEFVDYIRTNGPQVADTMRALGDAFLQIVEAAAPLGGPTLKAVEALAKVVSTIADSDMGTPILAAASALAIFNRASKVTDKLGGTMWAQNIKGANGFVAQMGSLRKTAGFGAVALGGLGAAAVASSQDIDLTNASMGAMAGLMVGGPWGAAVGGGAGLIADLAASTKDAEDAFRGFNSAVAAGNYDLAKSELEDLREEVEKYRSDVDDPNNHLWSKLFPASGAAVALEGFEFVKGRLLGGVDEIEGKLADAEFDFGGMGRSAEESMSNLGSWALQGMGVTAAAADEAAASVNGLSDSLTRMNNILSGRASWRDYEAALDAVTASIKENGKSLDITTEKGRNNQAALDDIAATSIRVAENLKGMDRVRFLQRARKDFIDAAMDLGKTRKQAEGLADDLKLVDRTRANPEVGLDDGPSKKKLAELQKRLDKYGVTEAEAKATLFDVASGRITKVQQLIDKFGITKAEAKALLNDAASGKLGSILGMLDRVDGRTATSTVITRQITQNIIENRPRVNFPGSADGGTIGWQHDVRRLASGGTAWTVPGQREPYGDKVYAFLAPGEEVITNRNGEADQFRADRAAGRIPNYADGGAVSFANGGSARNGRGDNSLSHFRRELREATRSLKAERNERDKLRDQSKQLRTTLRDNMRSDIFGDSDAWLGAGDPFAKLRADIAAARGLSADTKALKRKGLDGGALAALLAEASPEQVDQFAHMNRRRLAQYERLYNTRQRVTASVGRAGADAVYARDIRDTTREVRSLKREVKGLRKDVRQGAKRTGDRVGDKINGSARLGRSNQRKDRRG